MMATLTFKADESGQNKNERVFEREFLPLANALCTFAIRLTNDASRADDLVQETYMKAWRFIDGYTEGTNARAWLFRICRHAFINEFRAESRRPRKVDYEDIVVYHNEDDPVMPRYFGLHEEMGDKLMGDEVSRAITALPDNFKSVVLLDLEDFTYEEIAALLEIPIGTVRSRLHRARNVLADRLRAYAQSEGYAVQDNEQNTDETVGEDQIASRKASNKA